MNIIDLQFTAINTEGERFTQLDCPSSVATEIRKVPPQALKKRLQRRQSVRLAIRFLGLLDRKNDVLVYWALIPERDLGGYSGCSPLKKTIFCRRALNRTWGVEFGRAPASLGWGNPSQRQGE